jgi:hypothetical protein
VVTTLAEESAAARLLSLLNACRPKPVLMILE